MNINVTPEVTSAHRNLEELCKKFETSVDEFCALPPQSIRPHEFYECECVQIAAECADALSELQSACSYEVTAYENAVAEVDNMLRQQKRRFEENAAQRTKTYEDTVAEAEKALRQQRRRFEENVVQRTKTYEDAVAEADETYHELKSELESDTYQIIQDIEQEIQQVGVDISLSGEKTAVKETSKIPYNLALERVNRVLESERGSSNIAFYQLKEWGPLISSLIFLFWPIGGCAFWGYKISRPGAGYSGSNFTVLIQSFKETFSLLVIVPMIVLIMYSLWKRNRKPMALRVLRSAAVAERDFHLEDLEKTVADLSAERDQKVKDARSRKETEDKQAAEAETVAIPSAERDMNAKIKDARERKEKEDKQAAEAEAEEKAERDKKVEKARSRRDSAIAYIAQEHQAHDSRLCQRLDQFRLLVETWTTENADVTSILNENRVQNFSDDGEQIVSCLTRVGTVDLWNLS